ncbi:ROK family protein [Sulfuriroseicoccus oceanibius]|uniref:ROK family protein n=1 Tax=Sulfuriroseicoccus oceanibius TaxID=2707525 RepID=A0A6B3L4K4_9BACT|nr:ROK family protein [Sulfuriroseicoccus oceanibius]QQL45153.1 ROK family protein [Sulfuriroseicoccus oceanibius]
MNETYLGIDIGGTNTKFGIVSRHGELLAKEKYPTAGLREDNDGYIEAFLRILAAFLAAHPEITNVGIGVPGTLGPRRRSTMQLPNIPELSYYGLMDRLEGEFPGHVFRLENDANAAALGELLFATEPLPDNYVFLTLGTGVGGAVIYDKEIFGGEGGNAMEVGHIPVGNGLSLEQTIGKAGMVAMCRKYLKKGKWKSKLKNNDKLNSRKIQKACLAGDEVAVKVFTEVGRYLGQGIVSNLRILDIPTVILGGGVSKTYEVLYPSMMAELEEWLTPYYLNRLDIRTASLGNEAGILGAASLVIPQ